MRKLARILVLSVLVFFAFISFSRSSFSKPLNVDAILFDPATDAGRYFNLQDAQTLGQWRFSAGTYFDYAHAPLEVRNTGTGAKTGIVDSLVMAHVQGALGFTDWFSAGVSIPAIVYENYLDPNALPGAPRETHAGIGDIRLETKFKLLDNNVYPIGVAIVPLMTFPSGNSNYFLGNGKTSGGVRLSVEGNINHIVWIAMNWGYQYFPGQRQYYVNNADAIMDDLLSYGLAVHGRINDMWSLIAEMYGETIAKNAFGSLRQTPIMANAGARFTPRFHGAVRGLSFTLAAGAGLTKGVGDPNFHIVGGVNYRKPRIVELEEPGAGEVEANMEEKIIITQKIHFEFNKAIIRPISYPILDDVVDLLKKNTHIKRVRVEGHTDSVGSDAYNQRLSEKRAMSVVDYLVAHGISRDRLLSAGYGESRPIADNNTAEGRAKNRRTEFTVVETQ